MVPKGIELHPELKSTLNKSLRSFALLHGGTRVLVPTIRTSSCLASNNYVVTILVPR